MADPRLPNLTVQQLEYLVAAAASPTRAAAARGLGVTPSALTQGLAELERRVGVPLFERQGRQTRLRPQATEVLAHARRVVAE
ncbi:MAG TPA: LysR family transcriptional regulator, partial [Acidimicrobiaceae bacterium]|nr:LysR family transcriptional regulator [Acidimicrobiaceae bacterium]